MKKYRVFVEGTNFALREEGKEIFKHGFYTTRFVEARDSKHAEDSVIQLIRKELKSVVLNDCSDPPVMYVQEMEEISDFGNHHVPGKGFSWYEAKAG
ncbi:MAG: hypothetical protein C4532_05090 [Candidatus Abyssobacteria bacterium SURF_17]|uniref:Uncharacterized protein n=1 Tax=Candidatus Abyssobacteria bacterium SURF_17 TaxID=2093361 RepID=A0A419F403_9BACT|nr:MAG: hypothetical protein C4532_05090 [Candidatus Abyssubacteria bacterium SURF_17]